MLPALPSIRTVLFRMVCAALLLWAITAPPAKAQDEGVALRGFVLNTETGQPLPGAHVVLLRLDVPRPPRGAVANRSGYYHLPGLTPGRYALRASFVGYRTVRDTLRLSGGTERVTRTIEMQPSDEPLGEVVVSGESGGATTLAGGHQRAAPADIARVPTPSVSGDLTGYLQSLPGIVSMGDRGGRLFIRGGTPDQNLILMDKMRIFRPFHILGFYSVFPEELVSSADIYAGGFPAQYSGRISSVIDVEMRGGNRDHFEAAASVSPFLTGLRMEGPLNDDGLSLLATTRFSQIERTAPALLGQEQPLHFDDQFVKLQNTTETGRCGVTGLRTYDRGQIDPERSTAFRWSNVALGGRCVAFGSGSSSLVDVSLSSSFVRNAVGSAEDPEREATLWNFATKVDLVHPLPGGGSLHGGFEVYRNKIGYQLGEKFQGLRTGDEVVLTLNGHLGAHLPLGDRLDLRPGLAATAPLDHTLTVEPRLRASWRPFGSDTHELNAAFGLYRQTLVGLSDERDLGSVFTAWVPSPMDQPGPYAWHAILGWRQPIGPIRITAEGYYKDLGNLAVPIWSTIARFTTELTRAEGTSWGFDLRGEYERGPLYAYLGYGFSWTRYTASQGNFGAWFGTDIQRYHPPHDRRHELNAVLSADLGVATTNLRWQLGSGLPYTQPFGFDVFVRLGELEESPRSFGTPRLLYEKPYRARLPTYHRLDVSLERAFNLSSANVTAKAGAMNLYDRSNLFYFDLFTQRRVDQLPLVPYLAVEIEID